MTAGMEQSDYEAGYRAGYVQAVSDLAGVVMDPADVIIVVHDEPEPRHLSVVR